MISISRLVFPKGFTLFVVLAATSFSGFCADVTDEIRMPESQFAVFEKYCLECHDSLTEKGSTNLEELDFTITRDIKTAESWQKVLNSINSGEMPPDDEPQISDAEKTRFLEILSGKMVAARDLMSDSGGEITMRRLNRREYQNTMEALLGFAPDVRSLPSDDDTGGFDTNGASLFFSSDQFERYREIARENLLKLLLMRKQPEIQKIRIEAEDDYAGKYAKRLAEFEERRTRAETFLNQTEKPPTDFGFSDAAAAERTLRSYEFEAPQLIEFFERPENKTGATLLRTRLPSPYVLSPPVVDNTGGTHIVRVRMGAYEDAPDKVRYIQFGYRENPWGEFHILGQRRVHGTVADPQTIEFRVTIPPRNKSLFYIRPRYNETGSGNWNTFVEKKKENGIGPAPYLWVDWIEREGPFHEAWPPPEKERLVPPRNKGEGETEYARRVIQQFAELAFRGKSISPTFLDKLVSRYTEKRTQGNNFEWSIVDPLSLVLSSPSFLYLAEPREGESPEPMGEFELAARLSYFLWSSPPDDQLVQLAQQQRLGEKGVIQTQVTRMLGDERIENMIAGFTHQWLHMQRLDQFQFHNRTFPDFDQSVRENARQEVYANVRHILDHQLPLGTLLKSDFVIINDYLATYYGFDGVEGHGFRVVPVPPDHPRGGLLGMAAAHVMGSDGVRSSPVERGTWVLRYLLNDPPPPAPPNVPMLARFDDQLLSARELVEVHMEEPQCAQCHRKIDPIGFGMENFDAAGIWREELVVQDPNPKNWRNPETKTFPIEPHGTLPDGTAFANYFELRDAVAAHEEAFSRGFAKALVAYGLGRPFSFSDEKLVDDMVLNAMSQGNTIGAYLNYLIQSKQFRLK